jgi:hypothetical protein
MDGKLKYSDQQWLDGLFLKPSTSDDIASLLPDVRIGYPHFQPG